MMCGLSPASIALNFSGLTWRFFDSVVNYFFNSNFSFLDAMSEFSITSFLKRKVHKIETQKCDSDEITVLVSLGYEWNDMQC